MTDNFQNSKPGLASLPDLKFEREDWSLFRIVEGLQQKAGVAKALLRRLVLKELADNGLDLGADIELGQLPDGGYFVADNGPGIDGTPEEIARLFSINRPMVSSKLLRLPTRGALGNGLRVVAGAVLASEGSLVIITRDRRIVLRPERDGSTTVVSAIGVKYSIGTRVEVSFGPALPDDDNALVWARAAQGLAQFGTPYVGKSSPWWYDAAQFCELLYASGETLVRELIANLDGCTGAKAGEIVTASGFARARCRDITREQATDLLLSARTQTKLVQPKRLGAIGPELLPDRAYVCIRGEVRFGSAEPAAQIPFVVEAWAAPAQDETELGCLRQSHADHWHDRSRPRQARHRCLRLRAPSHRGAGTARKEFRTLAQYHHALYADHVRRQGAQPGAVLRRNLRRRQQGGETGAPPRCQG
jgi:hypothetical protein